MQITYHGGGWVMLFCTLMHVNLRYIWPCRWVAPLILDLAKWPTSYWVDCIHLQWLMQNRGPHPMGKEHRLGGNGVWCLHPGWPWPLLCAAGVNYVNCLWLGHTSNHLAVEIDGNVKCSKGRRERKSTRNKQINKLWSSCHRWVEPMNATRGRALHS